MNRRRHGKRLRPKCCRSSFVLPSGSRKFICKKNRHLLARTEGCSLWIIKPVKAILKTFLPSKYHQPWSRTPQQLSFTGLVQNGRGASRKWHRKYGVVTCFILMLQCERLDWLRSNVGSPFCPLLDGDIFEGRQGIELFSRLERSFRGMFLFSY